MTTQTKSQAIVELAHRLAARVPPVPMSLRRDEPACRAWEDFMLETAHGLAAATGHDAQALHRAIGPAIEVGVDPPWRVLLKIAVLVSTPVEAVGETEALTLSQT